MILIEAFPKWKENKGIFDYFPDPPWKDAISSVELNLEYFGNISGSKSISPLVSKMLTKGVLEDSSRQSLAILISSKFKVNWKRLWDAEMSVYDPVHNYNMYEDGTRAGTNRNEIQSSDETQHGRTNSTRLSHYGFNSQAGNPSDEDLMTEGGSTKFSRSGSVDYTIDENTTLHRYGNIGVTTSQQMIEAERSVRMWNYFNSVYKDIDSVLAIRIYDPCFVKTTKNTYTPSTPSTTEYSLPIASAETLGGVKIGDGVDISEDGTISVPKPVDLPFNFGIDENGNYGYIKVGADSVTPFSNFSLLPTYSKGIFDRYVAGASDAPKIYISTEASTYLVVYEIIEGHRYIFFVSGQPGNRFRVAQTYENPFLVESDYQCISPAIKYVNDPSISDCLVSFEASGNYLIAGLSNESEEVSAQLIDITKKIV